MQSFKVTYTDGTSYTTSANGTAAEFQAYLMQDGGRIVSENPVTGKETVRYIATVEDVTRKHYQIIKLGNSYRADEIINGVGYFSYHCGDNIKALVSEIEHSETPKPVVTFDTPSRVDYYNSLEGLTVEELANL